MQIVLSAKKFKHKHKHKWTRRYPASLDCTFNIHLSLVLVVLFQHCNLRAHEHCSQKNDITSGKFQQWSLGSSHTLSSYSLTCSSLSLVGAWYFSVLSTLVRSFWSFKIQPNIQTLMSSGWRDTATNLHLEVLNGMHYMYPIRVSNVLCLKSFWLNVCLGYCHIR